MKIYLDDVWAGCPVKFACEQVGFQVYLSYYNKDRKLIIAKYNIISKELSKRSLPETLDWDSHKGISMTVDFLGYIHISANMHNDKLVYYKSKRPNSIEGFDSLKKMVGKNENRCTYPCFIKNNRDLFFLYRSGGSGRGNTMINRYNLKKSRWQRLVSTAIFDGEGKRSAYPTDPLIGPDGFFHIIWVWRESPECETNHTLSYIKTRDFKDWYDACGKKVTLPIRNGEGDVIEYIPVGCGIINNNIRIGFDSKKRQIVTYHRFDEDGNTQIYSARFEGGRWKIQKTTDWKYRWDFRGKGSINNKIEVFPVEASSFFSRIIGRGLTQQWKHEKYGEGIWFLGDDLQIKKTKMLSQKKIQLFNPSMENRLVQIYRTSTKDVFMRWETLPKNRDKEYEILDKKILVSQLELFLSPRIIVGPHLLGKKLNIKRRLGSLYNKIKVLKGVPRRLFRVFLEK